MNRILALLLTVGALLQMAAMGAIAKEALLDLQPDGIENIEVKSLASDKNSSTFLIFIRAAVPNHMHQNHSESIYVLEGRGLMRVGDEAVNIAPGDFVHVPEGQVHGVLVTSKQPLKVLSIQAPEFTGADRVLVKD